MNHSDYIIEIENGNIFNSDCQTLVNAINCVGIMGKGIALEYKRIYPLMFKDYKKRCDNREVLPGKPYCYIVSKDAKIINFPTKDHWRYPSQLNYVDNGLILIERVHHIWGIKSIAFPAIGCGLGGLEWEDVRGLIYKRLGNIDIPIELYLPL